MWHWKWIIRISWIATFSDIKIQYHIHFYAADYTYLGGNILSTQILIISSHHFDSLLSFHYFAILKLRHSKRKLNIKFFTSLTFHPKIHPQTKTKPELMFQNININNPPVSLYPRRRSLLPALLQQSSVLYLCVMSLSLFIQFPFLFLFIHKICVQEFFFISSKKVHFLNMRNRKNRRRNLWK